MQLDDLWQSLAAELETAFRAYRRRLSELATSTKADRTLLTEADTAIEKLIVDRIRLVDPDAVIIAEEDGTTTQRTEVLGTSDLIWVIDPIDGTAEFVNPHCVEFCTAICVLRSGEPVAAFLLAPELGLDSRTLTVTGSRSAGEIRINGKVAAGRSTSADKWVSVTRSADVPARPFEAALASAGYRLKTRTTSQSLDMLRTAVDISAVSQGSLAQFELFYRVRQKVWDGLAGLCFGAISGLASTDAKGDQRLPVGTEVLSQAEPTFDATLMGQPEAVAWFLEKL